LLSLIYKISPRETRGRFCGGTTLLHKYEERNLRVKASVKPVQDLDKADTIAGGDFHIGVDESLNST